ncbi:MAG: hypothetical protein HYR56_21295 [Acidobacteria bacterium]|nr:hypothetical protein [Acidobacteriota bacterium]MBI3421586.1 hypothetical protein [Acidobacteriota bacterium]
MPISTKLICGGWLLAVCQVCAWAQTAADTTGNVVSPSTQTSFFFEVERLATRRDAPFTQFTLVVNRSLARAPRYSWQLAADGWAGGAEPYVSARLDACRRVAREAHTVQTCGGLGVYHDVRAGGVSPVAAISADGEWWRGRVSSYALFERAFTAPTFTYYQTEAVVALRRWRRAKVSAGVLSRTIQHLGGKLAVEVVGHTQVFVTAGSGRATVGMSLRF